MTNLLEILTNKSNNLENTKVTVFEIKIDTKNLIVRLLDKKFRNIVKATSITLAIQSITFLIFSLLLNFCLFTFQEYK